ncbi:MAG: SDR family oxidoreductase [Candidatus Micrarchaeota archaeon]|nr:SDR family oxidoreductase [Candidatus Micrarchaeota archaeon]
MTASRKAPEFRRRVAVVTGGSSGIGRELCRMLRQEYITYSFDQKAPRRPIEGVAHLDCDIASQLQVIDAFSLIAKPVDLLVNNAGVLRRGSMTDIDEFELDEMVKVNIMGSWRMIREGFRNLSQNATLLQISSERAIYPREDVEMYGLSKNFVMEMASQLSDKLERERSGIRVKIALFGPVSTAMLSSLGEERVEKLRGITISTRLAAKLAEGLLKSDYQLLRFDDPREEKSWKTGRYVFENFNNSGYKFAT